MKIRRRETRERKKIHKFITLLFFFFTNITKTSFKKEEPGQVKRTFFLVSFMLVKLLCHWYILTAIKAIINLGGHHDFSFFSSSVFFFLLNIF